MTYDQALAQRVRRQLGGAAGISEREQFGGIGFFVRGNMACGVIGRRLIVRVGTGAYAACLRKPGARVFDFSGRPMRGWVTVSAGSLATPAALRAWVGRGLEHARCRRSRGDGSAQGDHRRPCADRAGGRVRGAEPGRLRAGRRGRDAGRADSGICGEAGGEIVTVEVFADIPSPRCSRLRAGSDSRSGTAARPRSA